MTPPNESTAALLHHTLEMTLTDEFCETFKTKADCVGAMAKFVETVARELAEGKK